MCRPAAQPLLPGLTDPLPQTPALPAPLSRHDKTSDAAAGSRRRRLWELDGHAHCPVIGVCMPMPALRRLAAKVLPSLGGLGDYELHCAIVGDARQRTPVAEALQKELDRRYALPLQQAARHKSADALAAWWLQQMAGQGLAGAFWALLTHARCTAALEHRALGDVHMLQHQVGVAARVDLARCEALIDENAVLARELAGAQARCTRQAAAHAASLQATQAELIHARAEIAGRDQALERTRAELQSLHAAAPELGTRYALAQHNELLTRQLHELQRQLLHARQDGERLQRRGDDALTEIAALRRAADAAAGRASAGAEASPAALADRSVLCVGGRSASVPLYRHVVERNGARFLHHDGGAEDNPARLDATLAAADLVICQTGCISHDAYWRVKDHCKRTGKRCAFVDTPSRAALERALGEFATSQS